MSMLDLCPVRCLGYAGSTCIFLSPLGREVRIDPMALMDQQRLLALFDGQEGWLRRNFPHRFVLSERTGRTVELGINVPAAVKWLLTACIEAEETAATCLDQAPPQGWLSRMIARLRVSLEAAA